MTREEVKRRAELYSALVEGKTIQIKNPSGTWEDVKIEELYDIFDYNKYRIKPQSKYRPFKDKEECWQEMQKHQPVGYIMNKERKYITLITEVYTCNITNGLYFRLSNSTQHNNAKDFFKDYKFVDGTPFGIKEE